MDEFALRRRRRRRGKRRGIAETDENLPMSPDLIALLPDGVGESLAEEMEARGLTAEQMAEASGLGLPALYAILASEMTVSEEISRAIARGLGAPFMDADLWARLDASLRGDRGQRG